MTYTLVNAEMELNGASPALKLAGTEGSADPITIRENAGYLEFYDQSAAAYIARIKVSTGELEIRPPAAGVPTIYLNGQEVSADPCYIKENAGVIEFVDATGNAVRFSIAVASGNVTIAGTGILAVTTADKLTVGGVIVPQYKDFRVSLDAASVTQIAFIVHDAMQLHAVSEAHVVGSTSGTLMLRNCTSGQAAAAGLAMLSGTIDLSAGIAANTPQAGGLHATPANLQVAAGSMVQFEIAGVMTNLVGACVTLTFKRI
jgi:hypothetical protein